MGFFLYTHGIRPLRSRLRLPLRLPRRLRPVRPFPRGGEEDPRGRGEVFKDAEAKRLELIEAEKKQYEEYVEAQKKAVEDAVAKEKEFYEKERELVKKLGGYPYAFGGA